MDKRSGEIKGIATILEDFLNERSKVVLGRGFFPMKSEREQKSFVILTWGKILSLPTQPYK